MQNRRNQGPRWVAVLAAESRIYVACALACIAPAWTASAAAIDEAGKMARVPEVWVSTGLDCRDTDSLAACVVGGRTIVYATSKDGHRLDLLDGESGRFLRSIGSQGAAPGQFAYPNGIAACELSVDSGRARPVLAVVERDNGRVQLFWADAERSCLVFGEKQLNRPYGIATLSMGNRRRLYVTDTDVDPTATVKVFDFGWEDGRVRAEFHRAFGAADGEGMIRNAESLAVDAVNRRVLVCDEDKSDRCVKVYTLDGQYAGIRFAGPELRGEPEGIAVFELDDRRYVLVTDQSEPLTRWHVYDAETYEHRASFTGTPTIRNTDGIAIMPRIVPRFPAGGLVAVDDDCQIRAYSLQSITSTLPRAE